MNQEVLLTTEEIEYLKRLLKDKYQKTQYILDKGDSFQMNVGNPDILEKNLKINLEIRRKINGS